MLHTYFLNNSKEKNAKLFIILLVFTLVCIGTMQYFDSFLKTKTSPNGIVSFELAKNVSNTTRIVDNWKEKDLLLATGLSLGFDFLFILAYSSFIALLLFLVSYKKSKWVFRLGKLLIWLVLFAGFVDIIENISLIQLLFNDKTQMWVTIAYYMASTKFALLGISFIFIILTITLNSLKKLLNK